MAHPIRGRLLSAVPLLVAHMLTGIGSLPLSAQPSDISVLVRRSYTTTARIFYNPSAPSPSVRHEHTLIEGVTGFSAEVQVPLPHSDFMLGLSVEYLSHVDEALKGIALGGVTRTLPVRDGFVLVPVELRGIISIPLHAEVFELSMAGGGGLYYAERILEVAGVGVRPTSTTFGYGIHISIGMAYRIVPGLWVHGEARFRDPDVTLEYVYERLSTQYQGVVLPFSASPMQTRINVDGMNLAIGLKLDISRMFGGEAKAPGR